jgi:hypothetical protein
MPYHLFDIIVGKQMCIAIICFQRKMTMMMMRMSFGLVYVVCLHVPLTIAKTGFGESCLERSSLVSEVVRMILTIFGFTNWFLK